MSTITIDDELKAALQRRADRAGVTLERLLWQVAATGDAAGSFADFRAAAAPVAEAFEGLDDAAAEALIEEARVAAATANPRREDRR